MLNTDTLLNGREQFERFTRSMKGFHTVNRTGVYAVITTTTK